MKESLKVEKICIKGCARICDKEPGNKGDATNLKVGGGHCIWAKTIAKH